MTIDIFGVMGLCALPLKPKNANVDDPASCSTLK